VPSSLKLALVLLSALGTGRAALALSGSNTWYSGAGSGNWQTTSNWGSGTFNFVVPGTTSGTTNTDTATFDTGSSTTSIVPDANRNLGNISFGNSAAAYTISTTGGNALLMTSFGTIQIAGTFSGSNLTETIDAPLTLEGDYTLADNSANTGVLLDFGGAISAADQGGSVLTVAGAGATTISGAIGGIKTIDLVKSGAGTLTLSGNNTFTGGVTINAGTLQISSAGALNSISPNAVAFGPGSTGILVFDGAITISGLTTNATIGSPVVQTLNGGGEGFLTINNASDNTYGGVLKDGTGATAALGLIKTGSGTLTLSGNNTFTGGVEISAGTLQLGNAGALNAGGVNTVSFDQGSTGILSLNGNSIAISNLGGSGSVENANATPAMLTINNNSVFTDTYAGVLQDGPGGGALALTKNGTGTLTLSGNNALTGGVTINAGKLVIGNVGALNSTTSNKVSFSSGSTGTLSLNGNSVTIGQLNGFGAGGSIIQNANATPATLTVNFLENNTSLVFDGTLQDGAGGGKLSLVKSGTGTLVLTGNNQFTGGVTINAGSIQALSSGALNSASPNAVTFGPASTGSLDLLVSSFFAVSGLNTNSNVGTPVVSGNFSSLTVNNAADNVFAGRLTDGTSGTLALMKSGAGTLTLGGSNTFTGGVTINAGTLQLANAGALNSANPNAVSFFDSRSSESLALKGNSVTISSLNYGPGTPGIPIVQNAGSALATLTINDAFSSTYAGVLQDGAGTGALSLTKTGPGILALVGDNTYTGGTTVIGGMLNTIFGTATGTFGTGPLTISAANGITSAVNLGNSQTVSSLSGTLAGNGFATLSIPVGVTLTDNQSSGKTAFQGVLINSGTFAKSGTSSLEINSAPTLNANSVLQVNGGKLRFNFVTGAATIGTGVTAAVSTGATLELAAEISALSSGSNRANITNSSNLPGLLVSGTHQQVGNIDGSGTTQVNAGSDLMANHIVQSALMIGGTAGNPGLVTIDASDSSGNPLGQSSGFALAGSLQPSAPFASGAPSSSSLDPPSAEGFSGDPIPAGPGADPTAVPEPTTLLLALLGLSALGCLRPQTRKKRAGVG
jgi:autotransporter-associated beta strand protein